MKKSDQEILEAIRTGKDQQALSSLYDLYPKIKNYILKNNGDEEEAMDIFQDALLIFFKQVKQEKFNPSHEIAGFIYSVSRNLWINRIKKKNKSESLGDDEEEKAEPETKNILDELISEERQKYIEKILDKAGEKCRTILVYSIFHKMSMEDIAEKMGFKSANAAKTRNYKCKQKLIKWVHEHKNIIQELR